MLPEVFLGWLAKQILDKMLDALAERPAIQQVRRLLAGDPARAALVRAMRKAYAALEEQYPQLAADALHETFFRREEVVAELARVLSRRPKEMPSPKRLAELARAQYRPGYEPPLERLLPAAELFLRRFREAAEEEAELRPFFNSQALERLHEIAAHLEEMVLLRAAGHQTRAIRERYVPPYAPFGGRDAELGRIDELVNTRSKGYIFVTAPSGFGKTALLANFTVRVEEQLDPICVYHFLSQRDGTADEYTCLYNLCEQLMIYHREKRRLPEQTARLREVYLGLLQRGPVWEGGRLIIVLDGLDEALDWEFGRGLFPIELPPGVFVLFSARRIADRDWLEELELPSDQVEVIELKRLTRGEIAQALHSVGAPAAIFAQVPEILTEVERVVEGDPIYLRELIKDIQDGIITQENIAQQPRGLKRYFHRWWQGVATKAGEQAVENLLAYLAIIRGPIPRRDLVAIDPNDALDELTLDRVPSQVWRFVEGDEENGYSLSHPRFQEYVKERLGQKCAQYEERLLAYCARWREHESDYALEHYAAHLFEAGRREELYGLIDKEWMELKRRRTGSHRSFAADVDLAFRAAEGEGVKGLPRLVQCALLSATLGSLATQVPPEVLGVMARLGQAERALDYARLMVDPERKAEALWLISLALWEQGQADEARAVLGEALEVTRIIEEPDEKAGALSSIASALAQAGRLDEAVAVLEEALEVARTIKWPWRKARALSSVVSALAQAGRLGEALEVARTIKEPDEKARALSSIASALAQAERLEEALEVARTIEEPDEKANALSSIASALAQAGRLDEAVAVLEEALEVARTIEWPWEKAGALPSVTGAWTKMGWEKMALAIAQEAFRAARYAERGDAFGFLGSFAPVLASFGPEVLAETWRLVEEVESWWA